MFLINGVSNTFITNVTAVTSRNSSFYFPFFMKNEFDFNVRTVIWVVTNPYSNQALNPYISLSYNLYFPEVVNATVTESDERSEVGKLIL